MLLLKNLVDDLGQELISHHWQCLGKDNTCPENGSGRADSGVRWGHTI